MHDGPRTSAARRRCVCEQTCIPRALFAVVPLQAEELWISVASVRGAVISVGLSLKCLELYETICRPRQTRSGVQAHADNLQAGAQWACGIVEIPVDPSTSRVGM